MLIWISSDEYNYRLMMLWAENLAGVFEMHVLLVVIRFDNHIFLIDLIIIARDSCLVIRCLFLTGFMPWTGITL